MPWLDVATSAHTLGWRCFCAVMATRGSWSSPFLLSQFLSQELSYYLDKACSAIVPLKSIVTTVYVDTSDCETKPRDADCFEHELDTVRKAYYEKRIQQHGGKLDVEFRILASDLRGDFESSSVTCSLMGSLRVNGKHGQRPDQTSAEKEENAMCNDPANRGRFGEAHKNINMPGLQSPKEDIPTPSPNADEYSDSETKYPPTPNDAQVDCQLGRPPGPPAPSALALTDTLERHSPHCLSSLVPDLELTSRRCFLKLGPAYTPTLEDYSRAHHWLPLNPGGDVWYADNQWELGARCNHLDGHSEHLHPTLQSFPELVRLNFNGAIHSWIWVQLMPYHPWLSTRAMPIISVPCSHRKDIGPAKATSPILLPYQKKLYTLHLQCVANFSNLMSFYGAFLNRNWSLRYRTHASGTDGSGFSSGQESFIFGSNDHPGGEFTPGANALGEQGNQFHNGSAVNSESSFEELFFRFFTEASARGFYLSLIPIEPGRLGAQIFGQPTFPTPSPVPLPASVQSNDDLSMFPSSHDTPSELTNALSPGPLPDPEFLYQLLDAPLNEPPFETNLIADLPDWAAQSTPFTEQADQTIDPPPESTEAFQPLSVVADISLSETNPTLDQQTNSPIPNEEIDAAMRISVPTSPNAVGPVGPTAKSPGKKTGRGATNKTCSECNKTFSRKYELDDHMYYHTGKKRHSCPDCGKKFRTRANMNRHRKEVTCV
ncbi:hypothetical protein BDV93DRAFT_606663 [Ceratobasidium sp. AG-I]|nr:hypothetical protein BDV93DRAFT_606663 [Ceratobasidium sp. AG-I]